MPLRLEYNWKPTFFWIAMVGGTPLELVGKAGYGGVGGNVQRGSFFFLAAKISRR